VLLASAGVIGLWAIAFFVFELVRYVLAEKLAAEGIAASQVEGKLTSWTGVTSLVLNTGGFFGVYAFSRVTSRIGRKPAFLLALLLAPAGTACTFWFFDGFADVFWMIPLMGFCIFTLFGGYAIYFPELFPTRLRSTGTSFCYNVGRYVAAPGPLTLGLLASSVFGRYGDVMSYRYAGVTMCACFVIGLVALPFAPETKGQPLPE
jgi:MFS family permease